MFGHLSYRYKIPLTFSLVVLLVVGVLSATLIGRAYADAKQDLIAAGEGLGGSLSRALLPSLLRDDVWGAYETVLAPFGTRDASAASQTVIVLDAHGRVYVASDPQQFPTLSLLADKGAGFRRLAERIRSASAPFSLDGTDVPGLFVSVPIVAEGSVLGTVVLAYSQTLLLPRFYTTAQRVLLVTGVILALLLPLGWYWGRRMAPPLTKLATCMDQVGTKPAEELHCDFDLDNAKDSGDEISRLAGQFKSMLSQLKDKEELERQMVRTNRLAAIGRITAGIAHEINNPLGGMLNAISTFKRHGRADPLTAKTMSLLERGLVQVKDIVATLLVEARLSSHPLTPDDIDDVRTLVLADAKRVCANLDVRNALTQSVPLPSTMVRQILINLLLNAIHAAHDGGHIECGVWIDTERLYIEVKNDGEYIDQARMEHLFEPFASGQGNGLGLWVIYQIMQQLNGNIEVESVPGRTRFLVMLPVNANDAQV